MKRTYDRMKKNMVTMGMSLLLVFGLCSCGKDNKWLFSLHDEQLYSKDVAAFAYIYMTDYNIQEIKQLEERDDSGIAYSEYHKEQLEEDIIETVLLYKEAETQKIELSDDEKAEVKDSAVRVMEQFGEDKLEEYKISQSDVEHIYEMKYLGEAYKKTLTGGEDVESASENERFIQVYQVTFPIVQLDDNGMIQSNTDGSLKTVSTEEMQEMQQAANDFAEKAKAGDKMENLLKDCADKVTAVETYLKYQDLDERYKKAVDAMSPGEVSDVIESDYGYYVIRLMEKDAVEYGETISQHEAENAAMSEWEKKWEELYSEYAEVNKEYKNEELWETIELENYLK